MRPGHKEQTTSSKKADLSSRELRYEEAKKAIVQYIAANSLKPGDRLPTEETFRELFGWSRMTIARALNELVWEGSLKRVQGSGTYIAEAPPAESGRMLRIMVSSLPLAAGDEYGSPLFAGVFEEASAQHVDLVSCVSSVMPDVNAIIQSGVDGVLALCLKAYNLPEIRALHDAGIKIVGMALRSRVMKLPLVCVDNFGGICEAMQYLLDQGHRRIAYRTMHTSHSDVIERIAAFQYMMLTVNQGQPVDPNYLLLSDDDLTMLELENWWRSLSPLPTALLLDGTAAAPMLAVLQRLNVAIPDDLSVIVVDDVRAIRHFIPSLTVLSQPTSSLGRRGLEKLIQMLRDQDDGAPETLPPTLILRDSVRKIEALDSSHTITALPVVQP